MAHAESLASRLPSSTRDRLILATSAVIVAVLLIAAGLFVYHAVAPTTQVTAYFSETIGVYPGSTVRILGVPVGTVNAVTPVGTRVKVTMTLNSGVPVPASAGAVVISPSVVADRYIQLTPPYTRGPKMENGAVIPVTKTMVPVEVDEVYSSLAKFANALGPHGANSKGALSSLIKTGAANLTGNGKYLRAMLTEFGGLSKTLGGSANNLYASIKFLQRFTTMLKDNNGQVKLAENQLASVSGFLAADRTDLYLVPRAGLTRRGAGRRPARGRQPGQRLRLDQAHARRPRRPQRVLDGSGREGVHHRRQPTRRRARPGRDRSGAILAARRAPAAAAPARRPGLRHPGSDPRGRSPMSRRRLAAAAATLTALALTGCSGGSGYNGIYSIPLPGGANLGSHPYQVTAQFADAGDLVPQSAVMVNNVAVGRVTRIFLPPGSWVASVTMLVNGSVSLPGNAIAEIEQSSLLGEQFVALSAPPGIATTGRLAGGAVIPVTRTTSNATVEEVLGALSLLLNGGGIDQLHTITTELNKALSGNEPQIRELIASLHAFLANLNANKGAIETALVGLRDLSVTLAARDKEIGHVLDHLTPGLKVLADQRSQLVAMLTSLHKLTGVAVATINASQASLVTDLNELAPILRSLADAGAYLPNALQVLLTYPFTNQVLNDVKGDYLNAFLSLRAKKGTTIIPPVKETKPHVPKKGQH